MVLLFTYGLIFAFGVAMGSFFNVVAHRLPRQKSIVKLSSHCPHCEMPIPWKYKIPIISYLVLKGRCSNCGHPISWHYPVVELVSGLLTVILFHRFGWSGEFLFYLIFTYGLIVITVIDLQEMIIPNSVLLVMLGMGVVVNVIFGVQNWQNALVGMGVATIGLLGIGILGKILFGREALGMGDVKLGSVAGFFLGGHMIVYAIFFSFFVAFFAIVFMLVLSRLQRRDSIPFGPFMAIAMVSFLLWGNSLIQWYWGLFS